MLEFNFEVSLLSFITKSKAIWLYMREYCLKSYFLSKPEVSLTYVINLEKEIFALAFQNSCLIAQRKAHG